MTQIVSGGTTVAFGYDNANRKIWEDQTLSGLPTRRVNTPVDEDGLRTMLSLSGAYTLTYDYTRRQQLAHIKNGAEVEWFEFRYDRNGNLLKRQDTLQGLDSTNFAYDELNRPTVCQQTYNNDIPFATSYYGYDLAGRRQYVNRPEQGNKGERYTYDETGQLEKVVYNANGVTTATPTGSDRSVSYNNNALHRLSVNEKWNADQLHRQRPQSIHDRDRRGPGGQREFPSLFLWRLDLLLRCRGAADLSVDRKRAERVKPRRAGREQDRVFAAQGASSQLCNVPGQVTSGWREHAAFGLKRRNHEHGSD